MENLNNENYHALTKVTMEAIFSHLDFGFRHKYIDSGHDLCAMKTGKYQCNITALEEKQAFSLLGRVVNLNIQNILLQALDDRYPLNTTFFNEIIQTMSNFYLDLNYIVEPFDMSGFENLTWSFFRKTKQTSKKSWINFDTHSYYMTLYPWKKSYPVYCGSQKPKMIIIDGMGKPTYIPVIEIAFPLNDTKSKKVSISVDKQFPYLYLLKNGHYEIESIEYVMNEIRDSIMYYSLCIMKKENYIDLDLDNFSTFSTNDFLQYVNLHRMTNI